MSQSRIKQHFTEAQATLSAFLADEKNIEAIESAGMAMTEAIDFGGKIMSCGNGGSYCDALHFAEELTGRYREDRPAIAALALGDAGHITCVSNDYGYTHIFSRLVKSIGQKGDVLLAISTSGNSQNVINAVEAAKEKGIKTIGLTGKNGGKLTELVDIEIRAPHSKWADRAQEIHIKIIHALIDHIEQNTKNKT